MTSEESTLEIESQVQQSSLRPFTQRSIAERINRLSVASRTGNQDEVAQILGALNARKQNITTGFDYFVGHSSDLTILKSLEPILEAIDVKHFHQIESTLLKYSKLNLLINLLEINERIGKFDFGKRKMAFSNFREMFNLLPVENFVGAVEFLIDKEILIFAPERLLVFERMLSMSDDDVWRIFEKLISVGIEITIKKTPEEIENQGPEESIYRSIQETDRIRNDWYENINDSPFVPSTRAFYRAIRADRQDLAISAIEDLGRERNGIRRIMPSIIENVRSGKLGLIETHSAIFQNHRLGITLPGETFLSWAAFINEMNNKELIADICQYASMRDEQSKRFTLKLDFKAISKFIDSHNWESLEKCVNFVSLVNLLESGGTVFRGVFGYFLRELPIGTSVDFIKRVEANISEQLSEAQFGLVLTNMEANYVESNLESLLIFAEERNLLDEVNYLRLYKVGIVNLLPEIVEFVISKGFTVPEKRTEIRHPILKYEFAGGNTESALEMFEISARLQDVDAFDSVIAIQNCRFEGLKSVETAILQYLPAGLPFNEISVGSLCNRYSRNDQYDEVLRVLDLYSEYCVEDNTILQLYRLAALSNQNRESEARDVLAKLISSKNEFLIKRYAPSILRKIDNPDFSALAESLRFELKETTREFRVKELVEVPSGIVRNRNLPKEIKAMYDSICQVCGDSLESPFGRIAEAAHIQGLGQPHFGSDDISNLICLCPNHHKQFDNAGWYLTDGLDVVETTTHRTLGKLTVVPTHEISNSSLTYQRNYALNAANKRKRFWSSTS